MMIRPSIYAQVRGVRPIYAPVKLCEISFRSERVNPKYVSIDAEFVSAFPHGLFLTDERCPRDVLQIDFPNTNLDPSVAFIKDNLLGISRATGRFRGVIKRDRVTGRPYLWLQSVVRVQPTVPLPEPYNASRSGYQSRHCRSGN